LVRCSASRPSRPSAVNVQLGIHEWCQFKRPANGQQTDDSARHLQMSCGPTSKLVETATIVFWPVLRVFVARRLGEVDSAAQMTRARPTHNCALNNRSSTGVWGKGDRLPPQRAKCSFVPEAVRLS
jgi:hypothetical protein